MTMKIVYKIEIGFGNAGEHHIVVIITNRIQKSKIEFGAKSIKAVLKKASEWIEDN